MSARPAATRRSSRLANLVSHPERSAVALALLIGFASILSAVVAWRASLAAGDAARYESLAVQQQARREQIERELEGLVDQDLRFVGIFQEHALAARELRRQAEAVRAGDPAAADALDLQAEGEAALARAVTPFFMGASGIYLADDGSVPYDRAYVMQNLQAGNVELRELRAQHSLERAARADSLTLNLIAVAALIIAALFFLTIAQVSRTMNRIRQAFFVAGALMVALGTLAFLLVELLA